MKTLLAFGCSWTYGDELRDPVLKPWQACSVEENNNYRNSNCFGGLIAQHYNMQFVNMATPGGSLESMRYSLHYALCNYNPADIVALAVLTYSNRMSFYDPNLKSMWPWDRFRHSAWHQEDTAFQQIGKLWFANCHAADYEIFNLCQTVYCFEGSGVPCVISQILNTNDIIQSPSKTDFYMREFLKPEHYHAGGHPNEKGHMIIAQRLIEHIDNAKILA
jgi:hypothetical protein